MRRSVVQLHHTLRVTLFVSKPFCALQLTPCSGEILTHQDAACADPKDSHVCRDTCFQYRSGQIADHPPNLQENSQQ